MPQKAHTFTKFDDDLDLVRSKIMEMCDLVEDQLRQSLQAFFECNSAAAHHVIDRNYSISRMEGLIDSLCVAMIARQQPTASDLKTIVTSTKIVVHLGHIGNEARKIARITERLAPQQYLQRQHFSNLRQAAEFIQANLSRMIESFRGMDTFTAYQLVDIEDLTAQQFDIIFREMIQSMTDDPRSISSSLQVVFVAKSIERTGNHIKHISRLIIDASSRYSET